MIIARRADWIQLKLLSGERLLISVAQTGIRMSKLLWGVVPIKTVYEWSKRDMKSLDRALMHFMTSGEIGTLADKIAAAIISECKSTKDVRALCTRISQR